MTENKAFLKGSAICTWHPYVTLLVQQELLKDPSLIQVEL